MNQNGIKVLYIDDNIDDHIILEDSLSQAVDISLFETSTSLSEGIKLILTVDFDLIFLDLSLPDVVEFEAIEKTHKLTSGLVPIVVLTGLDDQITPLQAFKVGAQDYLIKGEYTPTILNKVVRYAIERNRFKQELISKNEEIIVSKNRLDKAEEMADIGSWEINLIDKTVQLSRGMLLLLRLSNEKQNMSLEEFKSYLHDEDKAIGLKTIIESRKPDSSTILEAKFVQSNGEIIQTFCKTEVARVVDETKLIIHGVTMDVTEQKEAERIKENYTNELASKVEERTKELEHTKIKLEEALSKEKELGELKSRFVSTASHQFRTPLTVIQSNIGLLEMHVPKVNEELAPVLKKITQRITSEVHRMTDIMNEVLTLGKINMGEISPRFQQTDIVEVCKEIVEKYNEIQEDGRFTKVEVYGNPYPINIDKSHLEHIISNIISNAFKYSTGKKSPDVRITFTSNAVTVEIQDYGMGIPKKELERLFTPFFRASNAVDIPGNGLGTTIIKEYVELNNGTIQIDSELNRGTKFSVQFKVE